MASFVVSWNTAGWGATLDLIRMHYGSLSAYLEKLQCGVFCLQETKVPREKVAYLDESLGARSPGWQSFWAFNRTRSGNKGSNGVATFVREDIAVHSATQEVLQDPEFDDEGRCLLTDFGAWCILNVYAPFVGREAGPDGATRKVRFLKALHRRMQELVATNRHVLLVGDLNLTWRPEDTKLSRQALRIDSDGALEGSCEVQIPDKLKDFAGTWRSVATLSEILGVKPERLSSLNLGAAHLALEEEAVTWFQDLLAKDWVDTFAEVHPTAQDRFTSWNQMCNLRYSNCGARLDYIICDRAAYDKGLVICSPSTELPGADEQHEATSSKAALHAATHFGKWHATATKGLACGDGLSTQTDNMRLNHSQFPSKPYTGMVYTPPSYSDHIAVAVALKDNLNAESTLTRPEVATKSDTKHCQPWRSQSSLKSFFGGGAKRQKINEAS
jgi:exonuclease III